MSDGQDIHVDEIWKAIPGYEGAYEVSNFGRVRSLSRPVRGGNGTRIISARERKLWLSNYGYLMVDLKVAGVRHGKRVSRLVLESFVGPCPEGMEAAHNNGIRDDNRLANLRWDTHVANCEDKIRHGTQGIGDNAPHAKTTEAVVKEIRKLRKEGLLHREIAERFNMHVKNVGVIIRRRTWSHIIS